MNQMEIENGQDFLLIRFFGELDSLASRQYREKIVERIEHHKPHAVIMEFGQVTFIDSSGIGLILGRFNQIKDYGGKLLISGNTLYTKHIFQMTGINQLIPLYDQLEDARRGVKSV